jgi:hypothetical protein
MTSKSAQRLLDSGWTFAMIPATAILDPNLSDGAFRQMAYMSWRRNQDGATYPSLDTIAEDMGKGNDTVARRNGELEEQHYIGVERGRGRSNHYTLYAKAIVPEQDTSRKNAATSEQKYPQKCGQSSRKNAALTISDSQNIDPGMSTSLLTPNVAEEIAPEVATSLTAGDSIPNVTQGPDTIADVSKGNRRRNDKNTTPDVGKQQAVLMRRAMYSALAEVCMLDKGAMGGPINQTIKRLSLAEIPPSPEEIRALYGRDGPWYTTDFRLDKRPAPSLAQVVSEIRKMRQAREAVRARAEVETSRAQGAGEW